MALFGWCNDGDHAGVDPDTGKPTGCRGRVKSMTDGQVLACSCSCHVEDPSQLELFGAVV